MVPLRLLVVIVLQFSNIRCYSKTGNVHNLQRNIYVSFYIGMKFLRIQTKFFTLLLHSWMAANLGNPCRSQDVPFHIFDAPSKHMNIRLDHVLSLLKWHITVYTLCAQHCTFASLRLFFQIPS